VAEQASGTVEETGVTGSPVHPSDHAYEHNSGKPMSWVAVAVITVGFIVGGVALVPHPTWWAFWLGVGIAVVGCLMTLFAKTFTDDWY
jgi:protein-S-isoprenylcysteine O-methyltransferase Ste14